MTLAKRTYFPHISPRFTNPYIAAKKEIFNNTKNWQKVTNVVVILFVLYLTPFIIKACSGGLLERDFIFLTIGSSSFLIFRMFATHSVKKEREETMKQAAEADIKIPKTLEEALSKTPEKEIITSLEKCPTQNFFKAIDCLRKQDSPSWHILFTESIFNQCCKQRSVALGILRDFTVSSQLRGSDEKELLLKALGLSLKRDYNLLIDYMKFYIERDSFDVSSEDPLVRTLFLLPSQGSEVHRHDPEEYQGQFARAFLDEVFHDPSLTKTRMFLLTHLDLIPEDKKPQFILDFLSIPSLTGLNVKGLSDSLFKKCVFEAKSLEKDYSMARDQLIEQDLSRLIRIAPFQAFSWLIDTKLPEAVRKTCIGGLLQKDYQLLIEQAEAHHQMSPDVVHDYTSIFHEEQFLSLNLQEMNHDFVCCLANVFFHSYNHKTMSVQGEAFNRFFAKKEMLVIPEQWNFPKAWAVLYETSGKSQLSIVRRPFKMISEEQAIATAMGIPSGYCYEVFKLELKNIRILAAAKQKK